MRKEKPEYRGLEDRLSDLADNALGAFEELNNLVLEKMEASADVTSDLIERISDRFGNTLLAHKIEAYQARKGLLGGDRKLIRALSVLSNEVLTEWRTTRQSIAEGFRKEAQIIREMLTAGDYDRKEMERHIAINEAYADGLENDVKIIDEELKERGIEL